MIERAELADDVIDALMVVALAQASEASAHGDVPIGAVVAHRTDDGRLVIVSARHNERELSGDPTAHAEVLALRDAAALAGTWRLDDHVLVATLEPCPMCAGAALAARIGAVVFGAADPKAGAAGSLYHLFSDPRLNHECTVRGGVRAEQSAGLLSTFFSARR